MAKQIYNYFGMKNVSGGMIHAARSYRGLSQYKFAEALQRHGVDVTQDTISRLEGGKRFVTDYELLVSARVLDVSVGCLVGLEPLPANFILPEK